MGLVCIWVVHTLQPDEPAPLILPKAISHRQGNDAPYLPCIRGLCLPSMGKRRRMTASNTELSNVAYNVSIVSLDLNVTGIVALELFKQHESTGEATADKKRKIKERDLFLEYI